ncbi:MAG: hypothetical protein ACREFT_14050, partial [Acetobacteraceae bacterium]
LEQAIRRAGTELQPSHPRRLAAELWLAAAEARARDCSGAAAQAQAARGIIQANHLASHPELADASAVSSRAMASCKVAAN